MLAFETDPWPYRKAYYHGPKRDGAPRHLVWHSTESDGTAEAIQRYFADLRDPARKASAHVTAGPDGLRQSVLDSYVAWAAPGANHDGMQIEIVGRARWTRTEWLRREPTLRNAASATAQYALKYRLPLTRISRSGLAANYKGITVHDDVSRVFKRSSHWDPGGGFPGDLVLAWAQAEYDRRKGDVPPPVLDPLPPFDYEVGFVWDGAPDEGVANVLRAEHDIRSLHRASKALVGVRVNLGFTEPPRGSDLVAVNSVQGEYLRGADRYVTADVARRLLLHRPDYIESLRKRGRAMTAARKRGETGVT